MMLLADAGLSLLPSSRPLPLARQHWSDIGAVNDKWPLINDAIDDGVGALANEICVVMQSAKLVKIQFHVSLRPN